LKRIFEDTSVAFFPQVPAGIDDHAIEFLSLVLADLWCSLLPPCAEVSGLILHLQKLCVDTFPSEDLVPNSFGEATVEAKMYSCFEGAIAKRAVLMVGPLSFL